MACNNCSGCHDTPCPAQGSLEMTQPELDFLNTISQLAFVPVARRPDDMTPHGFPDSEELTLVLQVLEKKQLITLDYDAPLKGWDYSSAPAYRVQGSAALTQRGQSVLELLEIQGIADE